jgi:hypothetical protein
VVGHLLPNLDFREDGSEFWWGVFSLCLSLSLCLVSLSRAAECNERSKRTTATTTTTTTTATTPREKELRRKSLFFLTSVCFQLFPKSPKEDTRSTLYIIIALLPRFCASSSLPPLKEESVSEAYSSLRARVLYPFIKSSGNICESAQKAVRGFDYVADLSV